MSARGGLSLLATGLALVLGLGLGAGPVTQETVADATGRQQRLQDRADALAERVDRLTAERAAAAQVVDAMAAPLVGDAVRGRTVVLVTSPRAERDDVRRVRSALVGAGATVVGTLALTGEYVDPALATSPLEDLALRLVPPGVEFGDGQSPIERVGTVLARALVAADTEPKDAEGAGGLDQDAAEVIAGLDELDAVRLSGAPGRLAELAVMVTGDDAAPTEPALTGLAVALDRAGAGAVVVGPGDATSGPLRWIRDAGAPGLGDVGSVDHVTTPAGEVALLLALAEQAAGGSGAYGTGRRADAVVPAVVPTVRSAG